MLRNTCSIFCFHFIHSYWFLLWPFEMMLCVEASEILKSLVSAAVTDASRISCHYWLKLFWGKAEPLWNFPPLARTSTVVPKMLECFADTVVLTETVLWLKRDIVFFELSVNTVVAIDLRLCNVLLAADCLLNQFLQVLSLLCVCVCGCGCVWVCVCLLLILIACLFTFNSELLSEPSMDSLRIGLEEIRTTCITNLTGSFSGAISMHQARDLTFSDLLFTLIWPSKVKYILHLRLLTG